MELLKIVMMMLMMILMQFASASVTTSVETTANKPGGPVKVELYYESLCFGCQNFISGPLQDAWKSLQSTGKNNVRSSETPSK